MNYYCIMVRTGGEEAFKVDALKNAGDYAQGLQFWFFKRRIKSGGRKRGEVTENPMFPGYVFMSALTMDAYLIEKISHSKNFYHFLNSNADIQPLRGQDLEFLELLIRNGETAGFSRVTFDENDRIVIISGPLAGFKGNIIRVNRRKQRVTVRIDMCGSISAFDLCYDLVSKDTSEQPK